MERWKADHGPTCKACMNNFDDSTPLPTCCSMITSNGHSTPMKHPQNLTTGCNGNFLLKNGNSKSHVIKAHINNSNNNHKTRHHLDLVKDSLCCFKSKPQLAQKKQHPVAVAAYAAEEQDDSCGLLSLKPRWLQPWANKKVFLAVFCLTSVLQGMYYTYFVSVLTTIEKLYQIQSKTTGLIMSATEAGQIGGALLLTYYGGQGHRPKWIACGMLVFAAASIFCATPHFLYSDIRSPAHQGVEGNSTTITLRDLRTKLCRTREVPDSFSAIYPSPSSFSSLNSSSDDFTQSDFGKRLLIKLPSSSNRSRTGALLPADGMSGKAISHLKRTRLPLPQRWNDKCLHKSDSGLHTKTTSTVLTIFFASLLLIGLGATAVYTLGIPYIDDNVATRESPLYFGITIGVRIFGPVFGFLLGSFCTSVYVNFPFETTDMSTDDPQWIGAWWLGVFIVGAALILTSFPMMSFPRKLPQPCHHSGQLHHKSINHNNPDFVSHNGNGAATLTKQQCQLCVQSAYYSSSSKKLKKPSLKDFPAAIRRLLKNEILLYRTASSVLHILPIAGLYTFLPKYLESQFQLTATMANMISGMAGILVMGLGIFASGTFMRKFKPNARFVARWIALSALAYAIGMVILMWFGCPLNNYVGLNSGSDVHTSTQQSCNETCNCSSGVFAPICTSEGVTYLSPCLAGCTQVTGSSHDQYTYKNCLCLGDNVTATNGFCPLQCNNLLPYVFVFSVFVLIHSTSEVGSMLLTLRCVEPKDKAMALGLISFAIGLFGNVPCPIIYGAVVDSACLFWEQNCGEVGACRLYDPSKFRTVFHGVTAVIMLLAFFVDIVVWYKAKSIQFQDEDVPSEGEEAVPFNEPHNPQLESSV